MQTEVEAGHGCPITMTFAATPSLRLQPELAEQWLPKIHSRVYDPRNIPVAQKNGATIGMAMTENRAARTSAPTRRGRRRSGWAIRDHRPQVLRLGADVRCVSRARTGGRRGDLFPRAALAPRRNEKRNRVHSAEA